MNTEKVRARSAVMIALNSGRMVRPTSCSDCGQERSLQAHHHMGYDREHWLDVEWLCGPCHRALHGPPLRPDGRSAVQKRRIIWLSDEHWAIAKQRAAEAHMTVSAFIRLAARQAMEAEEGSVR